MRIPSEYHALRLCLASTAGHPEVRIEGWRSVWLPVVGSSLTLTNLPGGYYTIRLRDAANPTGVVSVPLEIEQAFYQHWWFTPVLFLYALLVLGVVMFLLLQYRFRQQLRLQRMRNGIASDLHDDVGSTLGSVAYFAETVRRRLLKHAHPANAEVLPVLDKLIANAHETVESMRGIVWAIHPENDGAGAFLEKLRAFAQDLLGSRDVACRFQWDEAVEHVRWSPEQRRNLFLLVKESLHNAAKHAAATEVCVDLRLSGGQVLVEIRDDGHGFDSSANYAGNGLKTLRSRAAELGGDLTIRSVPGRGTSIEAVFPVAS